MVNLPLIESRDKNYQQIINKIFEKGQVEKSFHKHLLYKMSNFIMDIQILKVKNIIFDKSSYFWIDRKKIKEFTISVLAQKLLKSADIDE